jgi:DNA-binding XRE family transcriptional regulator
VNERREIKSCSSYRGENEDNYPQTGSMAPGEPSTVANKLKVGSTVRRLRKTLELTGSELCADAGISTAMLSRIENGKISPSLGTLDSLIYGGVLLIAVTMLRDPGAE